MKREVYAVIVVLMILTILYVPVAFARRPSCGCACVCDTVIVVETYISDDTGVTLAMDDAINLTTGQPHYEPTDWQPTVYAWGSPNGSGVFWNQSLHPSDYKTELLSSGANWIWKPTGTPGLLLSDGRTVHNITDEEALTGDIVKFKRSFNIPCDAFNVKGMLLTTADNAFYMYVNEDFTGVPFAQGNFSDGYNYTNFRDPVTGFPEEGSVELPATPPYPWSLIHSIDISSELATGVNTLEIVAINENSSSTPEQNPAGVIYKLTVEYELPVNVHVRYCPRTLNLRSRGRWITAIIKLPKGCKAKDVNVSSIKLNGTIPADLKRHLVLDKGRSHLLILKFDRRAVIELVKNSLEQIGCNKRFVKVSLTITGNFLDGLPFYGTNRIRIHNWGSQNNQGGKPA